MKNAAAVSQLCRVGQLAISQDRVRIIRGLEKIGTHEALEAISDWVQDRDVAVAGEAIEAMVALGAIDTDTLLELMDDGPDEVVVKAIEGLGKLGASEHIPAIREAGRGIFTARDVRQAAKDAIEAISSRSAPEGALTLDSKDSEGELSISPGPGALSEPEDT